MVEPSKTHHERVMEHLREAARHLDAPRAKVEASLQAHLEANPPILPTPPQTEETSATENTD